VFVLGELEQFTLSEIAHALGINPSTASTRLRAARREFERAAQRHHFRDTWRINGTMLELPMSAPGGVEDA